MLVPGRHEGPSPATMVGIIVGLVLLFIGMRSCNSQSTNMLRSQFAAAEATRIIEQQTAILPKPLQELGGTALARLQGGDAVVPITPVANTAALQVSIESLQQVTGGLQIKGTVKNTSKQTIRVPLAAFRFVDQTGTVYASQGSAAANLDPGGNTTLDLTLPIQNPTALTMLVEIPEADVHLEMQLLTGQ